MVGQLLSEEDETDINSQRAKRFIACAAEESSDNKGLVHENSAGMWLRNLLTPRIPSMKISCAAEESGDNKPIEKLVEEREWGVHDEFSRFLCEKK